MAVVRLAPATTLFLAHGRLPSPVGLAAADSLPADGGGTAMTVADARRVLAEALHQAGATPDATDDALLVVSELLTNALRHGRPLVAGAIRLDWSVTADRRLEVSVTDGGGDTAPVRAQPSVTSHGGRGLAIVAGLSSAWGVRRRPDETTVWAVLPLEG